MPSMGIAMSGTKTKKIRADELLVLRGLADSRSEAKSLLMAGKVRTGTEVLDKAGKLLPEDLELTVIQPPRFVSRGGEKLEGVLQRLSLDLHLPRALDIGASTGGFTDCLLQHGVQQVICLDVGRHQLHAKLRANPAVTNIEKYNARHLQAADLPFPDYPLIVTDVSFISLRLILPPAWQVLQPGGVFIALVKPQFEAEKSIMDQCKGVIRDPQLSRSVAESIRNFALEQLPDVELLAFEPSVIQGTDGNQEFLLALKKQAPTKAVGVSPSIDSPINPNPN